MNDFSSDAFRSVVAGWAKLLAGALLLSGVILVLMQGHAPPGVAGEVLRNNLRNGIDATPMFYTEAESLSPTEDSR